MQPNLDHLDHQITRRPFFISLLADAPYAFGTTLAEAQALQEAEWRQRLAGRAQFIARIDGRVAGMVAGIDREDGPGVELISMWVHPTARGSGLADRLVAEVLEWARGRGFEDVHLWVAEGNLRAERVYARNGFMRTGVTQAVRPGERALELEMVRHGRPTGGDLQTSDGRLSG